MKEAEPGAGAPAPGQAPSSPDPVPGSVRAAAKNIFVERSDLPRASLVYDSILHHEGAVEPRELHFDHPAGQIRIQISYQGGPRTVTGHTTIAGRVVAVLYSRRDETTISSPIERGRFGFGLDVTGLARVGLPVEEGGTAIWTEWFRV